MGAFGRNWADQSAAVVGKSLALQENLGELEAAANAPNDVNTPFIQPTTTSDYLILASYLLARATARNGQRPLGLAKRLKSRQTTKTK